MSNSEELARFQFDNLLFEAEIDLGTDAATNMATLRQFVQSLGGTDVDHLVANIERADSGLIRILCLGFRVSVELVYRDPNCQILDVIDEDDQKLLIRLANLDPEEKAAGDSPLSLPPMVDKPQPTNPPIETPPPSQTAANQVSPAPPGDPAAAVPYFPLDVILTLAMPPQEDYTLELWVYPVEDKGPARGPDSGPRLAVVDGKTFYSDGAHVIAGTRPLELGVWHHLAWRYDAEDDELISFLDGLPDAMASPWSAIPLLAPANISKGRLDGLRLSMVSLSGRELNQRASSKPLKLNQGKQPVASEGAGNPPAGSKEDEPTPGESSDPEPAAVNPQADAETAASGTLKDKEPGPEKNADPVLDSDSQNSPADQIGPSQSDSTATPAENNPEPLPEPQTIQPMADEEQAESQAVPGPTAAVVPMEQAAAPASDPPEPEPPATGAESNGVPAAAAPVSAAAGSGQTDSQADSASPDPVPTRTHVFLPNGLLEIQIPEKEWADGLRLSGSFAGSGFDLLSKAGDVPGLHQIQAVSSSITLDFWGVFSGTLGLTMDELLVTRHSEDLVLSALIKITWPADQLNKLLPGQLIQVNPSIETRLTIAGNGQVSLQLRSAPFDIRVDGSSFKADPGGAEQLILDLGDHGLFHFDFPLLSFNQGDFSAQGQVKIIRPPVFSSWPLTTALKHFGFTTLANLFPAGLKTSPEPNPAASTTTAAPAGLSGFATISPPTAADYSLKYLKGAGFTCDFFLPGGEPLKLVFASNEAILGIQLWGLGFGMVASQFNLTIDAETSVFIVDPAAGEGVSQPQIQVKDSFCQLATREMVLMFSGSPASGYLPLPLFFESLALKRLGLDGMELSLSAALPMPALPGAAALIGRMQQFLTQPGVSLDPAALANCPLSFILENTWLKAPAPGPEFGQRGPLLSLSGSQLTEVFNGLKKPSLDAFLDLLPASQQAAGDALALFFMNASLHWALVAPDSFCRAFSDPTTFSKQVESLQIPRPIPVLVQNLFGSATATAVVGGTRGPSPPG